MKKTTRVLVALLALTLVTSCFVGGTFAKYVTSNEGGDSARVAKFGVTITAADELFSDSYKDAKTDYTANEQTGEITVQASTEGTNVVAPGTQGALVGFAVTGTPEVDVQVTYDATLDLAGWELADSSEYCPIEITVGTETFKVGDNATDVADLKAKVEAAIEGKAALYHTNTDLSAVNDDVVVSWAWDFEGNSDVNDTYLGDQAAADNAATIGLTVKTTITQVD
ncbi:MAG: hypothetical protein IKU84_01340 [Clostridia bacterium]|nr:hypothetical protein [Clostridia bacterium]